MLLWKNMMNLAGINKDFPEKTTEWVATDDGKRWTDVVED